MRNNLTIKLIIILFIFLLLDIGLLAYVTLSKNMSFSDLLKRNEKEEIEEIVEIEEVVKDPYENIPDFQDATLQSYIDEFVQMVVKPNEGKDISIQYEEGYKTNQYVSFKLRGIVDDNAVAEKIFSYRFDEHKLMDDSVFSDDFILVCGRAIRNSMPVYDPFTTTNSRNLYKSYYVKENELTFMVDGKEVAIPLKEILRIDDVVNSDIIDENKIDLNRHIDQSKPMVAITYDDGPYATSEIEQAFYQYDSAATFFVVGSRLEYRAEMVEEAIHYGAEIGSHSYNHVYLSKTASDKLELEYYGTTYLAKKLFDYDIKLYRPPYGDYNTSVKETIGYPMILWSIDTRDWDTQDKDETIKSIMDNVRDGDVVLLHETHASSVEATKEFIPMLLDAGYQIVTVSEMLEARIDPIVNGHAYGRIIVKE